MTQTEDEVRLISLCLAREEKARADKKNGTNDRDDFDDAMSWLGFTDEAKRLHADGAIIVGGKIVI